MPVQPRTPKQTATRGIFTAASSQWRSITDAQRDAWNNYASQIARSDSLGQNYNPTGAELFVGSAVAGQSSNAPDDPPTTLPNYVLLVTSVAYVDPTPGPEALNVSINTTQADNLLLIETSGVVSPGITSAAAVRRWRSLPAGNATGQANLFDMTATPIDVITEYKRLFPSPVVGDVIWFRFTELFLAAGGSSPIANKQKQTFRFVVA